MYKRVLSVYLEQNDSVESKQLLKILVAFFLTFQQLQNHNLFMPRRGRGGGGGSVAYYPRKSLIKDTQDEISLKVIIFLKIE